MDNISCTCTCTTELTDKWTIHVCISCTCTCTIHLTDKWTIFHLTNVHVHVHVYVYAHVCTIFIKDVLATHFSFRLKIFVF